MSMKRSTGPMAASYTVEGCPSVAGLGSLKPIRPVRRRTIFAQVVRLSVAISFVVCFGSTPSLADSVIPIDLVPKPLPRLQPGIILGQEQDFGFSEVVTVVLPRLASGDVNSLPEFARRYASMFNLTILANVSERVSESQRAYLLDKVGIGFAMVIDGKRVVVTHETANQLGADLGMIDRGVLRGNEDCLQDVIQVARTDRLVVFDAKANLLVDGKHQTRILRHLLWASPASGKIGFLVWQLKENGAGPYAIDSSTMQLLPSGFLEDRRIHVSKGSFLSSKIPTPDRFALESMPTATPVPFAERMRRVSGLRTFSESDLESLLAGVAESLAALQDSAVARKP